MGLFNHVFGWAFDTRKATPSSPPQLDASSAFALARAIEQLRSQEQGWITLNDGQRLFSAMQSEYAFGDMDDEGRTKLNAFAEQAGATLSIMPVEGRIYFKRM